MPLRSYVFLVLCFCGFLSIQASTFELLWSNDAEVSGPATGLMDEIWRAPGVVRFNSEGSFFSRGDFSGFENVEGLTFPVIVTGDAIVKLTGTNTWNATYADREFIFGSVHPLDSGGLILDANPIIYLSEDGSGAPLDLGKNAQIFLGVGRKNGRVLFQENREDQLPNISAFLPSEATKLVALQGGPAPGTTATFGAFEQFPQRLHYNTSGRTAFFAKLEGDGVTFENNRAIYFETEDFELELLVRSGDIFPTDGIPGSDGMVTIDVVPLLGLNGEGRVAFMGHVTSNVVPSGRIDSLWEIAPDGEKSLVVVDRVPMKTASGGEVTFHDLFTALNQPLVDELGNIYFTGSSLIGDGPSSEKTLWRKESGGLVKLLTFDNGSLPMPASRFPIDNGDGTTTPFTVVFDRLLKMQVSDDGRVALTANFEEVERLLDSEGNVISSQRPRRLGIGLWAQDVAGAWELVAAPSRPSSNNNPPIGPAERLRLSNAGNTGTIAGFDMPLFFRDVSSNGNDGLAPPWWTPDGRLFFSIISHNPEVGSTYHVAATVEETVQTATGTKYIISGTGPH